jgi:NADH-quinone oxidoreductase subunit J
VTTDAFLFWFLAIVTLASGLSVILMSNPIYSALCLAMTMVGISALFVTLNAYFIAGVQLIVYAGAVMVLFVMVIMLFDLKHDLLAFTRGKVAGAIKIGTVGLLAGLVVGAIVLSAGLLSEKLAENPVTKGTGMESTKALGQLLFSRYIFGFEALGILLLVIAVGAVALARSKGGTHEH